MIHNNNMKNKHEQYMELTTIVFQAQSVWQNWKLAVVECLQKL